MKRFWILLPGLLVGLTAVGFAMGRTRGISTLAAALISAPLREPRASIVKVVKTEQGYALERDGQPYFIKGIGGNHYLETAKRAGANSVRTWGADNLESLLDHAQAQGLTVTIGIWLGQERQGFHYDNPQSVAQQFAQARDAIRRYRNHPVLLMWGIGNEMEGSGDNPAIWKAVNDIAKMAKQEDPNHPTMTVIAEIGANGSKAKAFQEHCPDVDILGINSYAGLASLPRRLQEAGFHRPYVVTEFGPPGPWEVAKTAWNAPIEPTSTQKADAYLTNFQQAIGSQPGHCLGSYAFLWGDKVEATPTWFGMLLPSGERLGAVDAMTYAWTNQWPAHRAPLLARIEAPALDKPLAPGAEFTADAKATDPDGNPLFARWEVRAEIGDRKSGGDAEALPPAHPEAFVESQGLQGTFRAPETPGAYRLYIYIYDGKGGAATGNICFYVKETGKSE